MENQELFKLKPKNPKALQLQIYVCPFCYNEIYFEKPHELDLHLYKSHLPKALKALTGYCKQTAIKGKNGKWRLKTNANTQP